MAYLLDYYATWWPGMVGGQARNTMRPNQTALYRATRKRRMDRLTADDIRTLAQAGESQIVEFKLEHEPQPALRELLVALAHADGGVVLLGVTDAMRNRLLPHANRPSACCGRRKRMES